MRVLALSALHALWPAWHSPWAIAHNDGTKSHYCSSCGKYWGRNG